MLCGCSGFKEHSARVPAARLSSAWCSVASIPDCGIPRFEAIQAFHAQSPFSSGHTFQPRASPTSTYQTVPRRIVITNDRWTHTPTRRRSARPSLWLSLWATSSGGGARSEQEQGSACRPALKIVPTRSLTKLPRTASTPGARASPGAGPSVLRWAADEKICAMSRNAETAFLGAVERYPDWRREDRLTEVFACALKLLPESPGGLFRRQVGPLRCSTKSSV